MDVKIEESWRQELQSEFEKEYFKNLFQFVKSEYTNHQCFPPEDEIFSAFAFTPFEKVKVVILGQDPYHGPNQANGLCFSVGDGIPFPPSLQNIFKEIATDLDTDLPLRGNLDRWAAQGVLLLNATLTVRAHDAGSHQRKGWEQFTDAVIAKLSEKRDGIIFLLWGGYAKKKGAKINLEKHYVLESGHPSPLSANRGYWFDNKHFSKTNVLLTTMGKAPIDW